ncbi:MAG: hypothetical protein H0V88_13370 [Pyrinomonadaceae bacterium]|nr:hypothetical protein [Pyrinomonadaceae bacterium]
MKSIRKISAILVLTFAFASVSFASGDMGTGASVTSGDMGTGVTTTGSGDMGTGNTITSGDMGTGAPATSDEGTTLTGIILGTLENLASLF